MYTLPNVILLACFRISVMAYLSFIFRTLHHMWKSDTSLHSCTLCMFMLSYNLRGCKLTFFLLSSSWGHHQVLVVVLQPSLGEVPESYLSSSVPALSDLLQTYRYDTKFCLYSKCTTKANIKACSVFIMLRTKQSVLESKDLTT